MNLSAYEGTVAAGIVPWIEGDRSFESGLELSKETSFEGKGSSLGGGGPEEGGLAESSHLGREARRSHRREVSERRNSTLSLYPL